ncbi:MAG: alanine racemase [Planctomycetota bacterium]|nr:alanine racemase [Planctomycetota bacterium]
MNGTQLTIRDRAWAEVDLGALEHNIERLRRFSGNRALLVLAKANAYGHGAVEVARTAIGAGAALIGVADVHEGLELRDAGIDAPILILGPSLPEEIPIAVENALQISLSPADMFPSIEDAAKALERKAVIHLMVDTGMSRNGIASQEAIAAAREASQTEHVETAGLATHFIASEDVNGSLVRKQLDAFRQTMDALAAEDLLPPLIHAANSCAVLGHASTHFNLVRPGISVYGMNASDGFEGKVELNPVLSVRARITMLREIKAGDTVGYGATFRARRSSTIATVPVGYADGWPTSLSNKAEAAVHGQRVPIAGSVSMDCLTLDVTDIPDIRTGDVVTLLGRDGHAEIRAEELAGLSDRIPYEVTCGLGRRIRHHYHRAPCAPSEKPSRAISQTFLLVSS